MNSMEFDTSVRRKPPVLAMISQRGHGLEGGRDDHGVHAVLDVRW